MGASRKQSDKIDKAIAAKMKSVPSEKHVKAEIEKLLDLKYKVRSHSAFGDDNVAAIEAAICVLEEHMDNDDIYERYEEQRDDDNEIIQGSQNELDHALEALQWMQGDEKESPSSGWVSLVSK